ncbi:MAG TPA: penicillin-binding protein activator LpoB [Verrucomicrobiae bacterium]|nr:penicillin-binding protein activator LpoB [Verrucomicrobiae bacterium]
MKIKVLIPLVSIVAAVAGCSGPNAHYIQTGGQESVVNVGQINIQDFMSAADAATGDLLASGVLDRVQPPPAVLAISRMVNNTSQQIDTDLLVKRIRVALLHSGKAVTTTTYGVGGPEDPLAARMQGESSRAPDFTLSGKIIETYARAGNIRQATYSFQLSLTDRQGLAVWESDKDITKQGARPSVGF